MILLVMVIIMGMMLLMQACEYRVHYFEHPCQNSLKHLKLPKYFMLLNVFEASKIFYVVECILSFSFFRGRPEYNVYLKTFDASRISLIFLLLWIEVGGAIMCVLLRAAVITFEDQNMRDAFQTSCYCYSY